MRSSEDKDAGSDHRAARRLGGLGRVHRASRAGRSRSPTVTQLRLVGRARQGSRPSRSTGAGYFNGGGSSAVTARHVRRRRRQPRRGYVDRYHHRDDGARAQPSPERVRCRRPAGVHIRLASFTVTSPGVPTVVARIRRDRRYRHDHGDQLLRRDHGADQRDLHHEHRLSNTDHDASPFRAPRSVRVRSRSTNSSGGPAAATFTVTAATPTITSFSPTSGTVGTSVAITGTNFTGVTAVRFFNGQAATFWSNSTDPDHRYRAERRDHRSDPGGYLHGAQARAPGSSR